DKPRTISALGPVLAGNPHAHSAFLRLEIAAFFVHSSRGLPRDARLKEARVDIIEDIADIREIYGEPMERTVKKQLPRLEKHSRAFIALSPFLVIASSDPSGRCDASPKGDAPGFVKVIDDQTLLIPDRLGNNRVDTIRNLLARPGVGARPHHRGADRHRSRRGRAPDGRELPHPPLLTGSQPTLAAALFVFGLVEDALCIARGRFGLRFLAVLPVDAGEFQLDIGG